MAGKIIEFPGSYRGDDEGGGEKEAHLDVGRLTEMLEFLMRLRQTDPASFSQQNVDIRSELLETASPQELFQAVSQSSETEWGTHPSYYDAVISQLKKRHLIPGRQ